MRGRELLELKLPQMVEVQKREEERKSATSPISPGHIHNLSQLSTASDMSSPTTPGSSYRGPSRLPSSNSSSPASPTTRRESQDGFGTPKRPLTDVKEEPLERDEDIEMINGYEAQRAYSYTQSERLSAEWTFDDRPDFQTSDYDLADDSDFGASPIAKRQRADSSPFVGIAAKINAIKPSLSRKFTTRKPPLTIAKPGASRDPSLSRANSTRAPSFASGTMESSRTNAYPPTPTQSALDESFEDSYSRYIDANVAASHQDDEIEDQAKPTTPLLPPLMTALPEHINEMPLQSPLQSPAVADPGDSFSLYNSPLPTPQIKSLPSPPLSTRPSIASFHRQPSQRIPFPGSSPIVPSADIPPHPLDAPPLDDWADTLGHANFAISPEPYCPPHPSAQASKQLRADWDAARDSYLQHLARTGEHYGPTSKTYRLTEEKWAGIDTAWKRNFDACAAACAISSSSEPEPLPILDTTEAPSSAAAGGLSLASSRPADAQQATASSPTSSSHHQPPPTRKPSLPPTTPRLCEGKFPGLGEEGIVGPMEVVAVPLEVQIQRQQQQQQLEEMERGRLKRKRKWGPVLRWVQGVFAARDVERVA